MMMIMIDATRITRAFVGVWGPHREGQRLAMTIEETKGENLHGPYSKFLSVKESNMQSSAAID